jgi:hypothetical protein
MKHADTYEPDDRLMLIRTNKETKQAHWSHPSDGSPHGSTTSDYVTFDSIHDAIATAKRLGYAVTFDHTNAELLNLLGLGE